MTSPPTEKPVTGLDEFRAALLDYKSISSWAMGGTVAVPLVDYVMRLGPPWPWAGGVPITTSVAELLTLICVFHFWSRSSRKAVSRRMVILIILLVICFGAYLYHNSTFTFFTPVGEKLVKGFTLRSDEAPLIPSVYPTADDALEGAEYRPDLVWTSSSITAMRLTLLFLWLFSFVSLSAAIASFTLYHRRRPARSQNITRKTSARATQ
jgi:TctA family transporter